MSDAAAVTYQTLIQEVFIDPIRTVVVIDDEFPTLDDLVVKQLLEIEERAPNENETSSFNRSWKSVDVVRVQEILKFARSRPRPWLVDVHDGNKVKAKTEQKIAPSLDHSDLMVLDYHLNGDAGSGEAAIEIMRRLAQNKHHNLVIVYTKGYDGDPERVMREIALGLSWPDSTLSTFTDGELEATEKMLAAWDDQEPGIMEKLKAEISSEIYLAYKQNRLYKSFLFRDEGAQLKSLFKQKPKDLEINIELMMQWLFLQRQKQLANQLSSVDLGDIRRGGNTDCNWLSSENLFITIVPKTVVPSELEPKLRAALEASFPSPHRLLVSMMRAAISEHGSAAEAAVLSNRPVQTAWLDELLNPAPADENTAILGTITRHWEALGDQLRYLLQPFSANLRSTFVEIGLEEVFKKCGLNKADLSDKNTILSYNKFISTKAFDRHHLTTGHIFSTIDKSNADHEVIDYWICLTPACDMIPGQKKDKGWNARLESAAPFNAFKLFPANSAGVESASRNSYVYFDIGGTTTAFSIYPDNGNVHSNPEWEQMFASNFAKFSQDGRFSVTKTSSIDGQLRLNTTAALIIAQLRAEYALNLLQRAGAFLSRPGLGMGFKSLVQPTKTSKTVAAPGEG